MNGAHRQRQFKEQANVYIAYIEGQIGFKLVLVLVLKITMQRQVMEDIQSAAQSAHICLCVEYTAALHTPPAGPVCVSLSQQFHPASTISYD